MLAVGLCLRCWQWDRELKEYQFLQKEAERGQLKWEAWAGRYLAVLGSAVLLPDHISAARWGMSGLSNTDLPAGLITFRQKSPCS